MWEARRVTHTARMAQWARGFFEEYFRRLYRDRDLSVIDEMRAPEAGTKGLVEGRSYRAFVGRLHEVFDDAEIVIDRVIEQGEEAALFLRFVGRTRDGRRVEMRGSGCARLSNGKITDAQNVWDVLSLFGSLEEPIAGVTSIADAVEEIARRHGAREAT